MENMYVSLTFANEEVTFVINNFPLELMSNVDECFINTLIEYKWYMKGMYDTVNILNNEFTITAKTKKKVVLIRANT